MTARWPSWASVVSSVLSQCFLVLQGVVIARTLGPAARGELGWIQWAPPLVSAIAFFGMTQAIGALAAAAPERGPALFWSGFVTALCTAVVISGIVAMVFMVGGWPAPQLVTISTVFLLSSVLEVIHAFPRDYLVSTQDFRTYDLLKLLQSVLSCGGILALSLSNVLSPTSAALALLSGRALLGLVSWFLISRKLLPMQFASKRQNLEMWRFGSFCLIAGLAAVFQTRVLQWHAGFAFGTDGLGLYLVAATWGSLGGAVWQVMQVRLYPAIARAQSEGRGRAAFQRAVLMGGILCVVAVAVGVAVTPALFPLVMGKSFSTGVTLAVLFAIAAPIQAYGTLLGFCLRGAGRPGQAMIVDYAGAGGTVAAAIVFTKVSNSLSGFAWATAIGGLVAIISAAAFGLQQSENPIGSSA